MSDLSNILQKLKTPKILVVGDLMLDEYLWGSVDRISEEAPIPVLDIKKIDRRLGGAANTAYNVKALGDKVFLAGVTGDDEKGAILRKLLEEKGINSEGVTVDGQRKTTLKTRAVAQNQQVVRIDIEDRNPIDQIIEDKIVDFVKGKIKELSAVIISDYAKGVITPALSQRIIALARENNVFSVVDPKGNDVSKYRGCTVIAPNKKELGIALNIPSEQLAEDGRFFQAAKMLMAHAMSDGVLVKCGAKGMVLFEKNGDIHHFPALNNQPFDVSGAGDTAISVFALAVATGASPKEAVVLASHACAVEVGKIGTAVVLPEEMAASLRDYTANQNKIKTQEEIIEIALNFKKQGKKVVTCNGSFDVLHQGHFQRLKEAKAQGDVLIVCLNSDESVRAYKGPGRPVNKLAARLKNLADLEYIDYLVVFDELNPKTILAKIKPDIHCVGQDWGKDCVEKGVVEENGGRIHVCGWAEGFSTSNLVNIPTVRAVFLDRDGVINVNEPEYVHRVEDFKFADGVIPTLQKLSQSDYKIVIATNQSGIGRGYFTENDLKTLHQWMLEEFKKQNIRIDGIYYCPHRPDENCACRKPKIGMLEQAVKDLGINLSKSWIVGDSEKEVQVGKEANLRTIFLGPPDGEAGKKSGIKPHYQVENLAQAVETILNKD